MLVFGTTTKWWVPSLGGCATRIEFVADLIPANTFDPGINGLPFPASRRLLKRRSLSGPSASSNATSSSAIGDVNVSTSWLDCAVADRVDAPWLGAQTTDICTIDVRPT